MDRAIEHVQPYLKYIQEENHKHVEGLEYITTRESANGNFTP